MLGLDEGQLLGHLAHVPVEQREGHELALGLFDWVLGRVLGVGPELENGAAMLRMIR